MDVTVKDTGKKGKGVFASRAFNEGEIIITIDTTAVISKDDIHYLPLEDQDHTMYLGKGNYIVMKAPECYINHSCEPNCSVADNSVVARRAINEGEDITCDYSLSSVDPWKMECFCGSRDCRRIIEGDLLQQKR